METGYLPNKKYQELSGLCGAAFMGQVDALLLDRFQPNKYDVEELLAKGYSTGWWGYEGDPRSYGEAVNQMFGFTTLRQTIVLFMACMAGEKF